MGLGMGWETAGYGGSGAPQIGEWIGVVKVDSLNNDLKNVRDVTLLGKGTVIAETFRWEVLSMFE